MIAQAVHVRGPGSVGLDRPSLAEWVAPSRCEASHVAASGGRTAPTGRRVRIQSLLPPPELEPSSSLREAWSRMGFGAALPDKVERWAFQRSGVADLWGEQARPLLLEERRGPPFEEPSLVVAEGGLARLHPNFAAPALELEGEAGDRAVGRERQPVLQPQRDDGPAPPPRPSATRPGEEV